jgi:hypothetical protein
MIDSFHEESLSLHERRLAKNVKRYIGPENTFERASCPRQAVILADSSTH